MIGVNWIKSKSSNALGVFFFNSTFGFWPLKKNDALAKIRYFISMFHMVLMLITSLYEISNNCDYTEYSVDTLIVISFDIIAIVKLIFYKVNRDKLRFNLESAIDDWSSANRSDYNPIMNKYKNIYAKVVRNYLRIGGTAALLYPLKSFFFDRNLFVKTNDNSDTLVANKTMILKKKFLFPLVCSFNDISQPLYWLITLDQCVQYIICVGVNLSADVLFIMITYHLGGQFEILKTKFASFKVRESETRTRHEFGVLVARHKQLLKLTDFIEDSFNMIIFTHMLMNLILINVTGFNFLIFLKKGNKYGAITNFGILVFTLVQTFIYAYIGQNISSQVEEIGQAVYESPWRKMPMRMSKDVIILLMRSNTSTYLTAGKFFKMTRSTFTSVVKTAISYLSVLNVLIKD